MHRPTVRAVVPVPVPALELWLGLVWWVAAAVAFPAGVGTVVLAGALIAMAWLFRTVRRAHGNGAALPRGGRAELLRRGGITLGAIVALSMVLGYVGGGYAELTVPVACALVGLALVRTSALLGARSSTIAGIALVGLGAGGAFLALNTAGQLYQGLVGVGAGAALWVAGGVRTRLLTARYGPR